jgi:hypothetical protein
MVRPFSPAPEVRAMPVTLRFLLALAAGAVGMVVGGVAAAPLALDRGTLLAAGAAWRALREPAEG